MLKYDRDAIILFLLVVVQPLISFSLQIQGTFVFAAAKVANRIWAAIVLIVIFFVITNIKKLDAVIIKFKSFLFSFSIISIILMGLIWGFLVGNNISYITADLVLILILPILYTLFALNICSKGIYKIIKFLSDYLRISILFTVLVTLPLFFVGYLVRTDFVIVSAFVLAMLFFESRKNFLKNFLIMLIIILLLVMGESKILILQILLCLLINLFKNVKKLVKYVIYFVLIFLIIFGLFEESVHNTWVYRKSKLFLQSINVLIEKKPRIDDVLNSPFVYLDASTGHRVLELKKVIDKISESAETMLFGYGLGADISLIETQDYSVALAHGGYDALKSVRVIHLGIAFVLLKLGLIGLIFYIIFNIWLGLKAVKLIHNAFSYLELGVGFALLMYMLGAQFTFANYVKMPTFWILLVISGIFKSQRTSYKHYEKKKDE